MAQAPSPLQPGRRRVAAIDMGTNSIHLLIAEVDQELRTCLLYTSDAADE